MPRHPPRILMVSSEVESFARTGGLGDVVLGLARALSARGAEVVVVTPLYGNTRVPEDARWWEGPISARVGWGAHDVISLGVKECFVAPTARVCLLAHDGLYGGRAGIYGDARGTFGDNELRFATLSRGALSVAEAVWGAPGSESSGPDLVHAHDWHAALSIVYPRSGAMGWAWGHVPAVFTVHNLAYQGVLAFSSLDRLGVPRAAYRSEFLEHKGLVNLLKGAISMADRATTVSPTYAREILAPWNGFGLSDFLRAQGDKLVGIVNGIDAVRFDPTTDTAIARTYDANSAEAGRRACKEALLREAGLDGDVRAPLFACVSRLTWQKGIDLFLQAIPGLVDRGARVVLVGTGEDNLENGLRAAAARFPGRVASRIAFDEGLARRVYAGADFFVVPSRYEPCGLTQMYAMRYGAIPVVTDVGGLHDTVEPYEAVRMRGTGFLAHDQTAHSVFLACDEALTAYWDVEGMRALVARAMAKDCSWERSAEEYLERVYLPLIDRARGPG